MENKQLNINKVDDFVSCTVCGNAKPISEFYEDHRKLNGHRSDCKKCCIVRINTEKGREKSKLRNREYRKMDLRRVPYYGALCRSKKEGLPFSLIIDDIYVPANCPVFGTPLIVGKKYNTENSPTLDRIVPFLGYVKGNIAIISYRANRIKNNSTIEQIESIIKYIKSFSDVETQQRKQIEPTHPLRDSEGK